MASATISPLPGVLGDWLTWCKSRLLPRFCCASTFLTFICSLRCEILKEHPETNLLWFKSQCWKKSKCANLILSTLNKRNTDFSKQNIAKLHAPSKLLEVHGIPFVDLAERWIRQQKWMPRVQKDPDYLAYDCFQFHGPLISYGFP